MSWIYQGNTITVLPDCVGFVYLITNQLNKKRYIGKKLAHASKTRYKIIKLKNGNKKRIKIKSKVDSDWLTYYGSSIELNHDVNDLGSDNFSREILLFCNSKAECTYYEAKLQFQYDVLLSDQYYNKQISCRIHYSNVRDNNNTI